MPESRFDRQYFEFERDVRSGYSFEAMEKLFSRYLDLLQKAQIPRNSKVLDIGCAFGHFLRICDALGLETYGLDISRHALNQAKNSTRASLCIADLNKGLPFTEFFDVITIFDVIEHMESPSTLLTEVYRVLKANGIVAIATPNINALVRRLAGQEWYGYKDKTHLHLFTPKYLQLLVRKAGFRTIRMETPFHDLPKVLQKLLNKINLGGQIWLTARK